MILGIVIIVIVIIVIMSSQELENPFYNLLQRQSEIKTNPAEKDLQREGMEEMEKKMDEKDMECKENMKEIKNAMMKLQVKKYLNWRWKYGYFALDSQETMEASFEEVKEALRGEIAILPGDDF